ncbi:MAG: ribonuclease [Ignavibacteria bacterium]|nr:ribonuclease [Ignavibacteria bacterium]
MKKDIIINSTLNEVRVAITEDNKLAEFHIELPDRERIIGNIYYGRVTKIVHGINAAFIDIGLRQDAFLHFSDIDDSLENSLLSDGDNEDIELDLDISSEPDELDVIELPSDKKEIEKEKSNQPASGDKEPKVFFNTKSSGKVQINLEAKQEVIVQVVREAYAGKGVKVTTRIGIPGRFVVLLPFEDTVGVSKKITPHQESRRLRALAKSTLPKGYGGIIRTASQGQTENELKQDWQYVIEIWQEIEKKVKKSTPPTIVHQDMQLAASIIRDLFTSNFDSVWVDSKKIYKEISTYVKKNSPELLPKVQQYSGSAPIFDHFGIEKELASTYRRKVNLPSGGSIVIDQTEAMTVVDVNSGKSKETEVDKSAFRTNIEAVREIARQIRIRDLSGIILIDMIDMRGDQPRKRVVLLMKKEMARDRAKTIVYPLTQLCLMQITRQRINQNIYEKTSEICTTCNGRGRVTSKVVLINAIERWLKNFRSHTREFSVIIYVNPLIADYLTEGTLSRASRLMIKYFIKINVQRNDNISLDSFRVFSVRQQKDITNEYL